MSASSDATCTTATAAVAKHATATCVGTIECVATSSGTSAYAACAVPQPCRTAAAAAATVPADNTAATGLESNAVGAACVSANVHANVSHATDTDVSGGLADDSVWKCGK